METKQFNKWWKKERRVDTLAGYKNDEDVWRAALECVRDEMLPNCHEPMDIYDFIEEELNGN